MNKLQLSKNSILNGYQTTLVLWVFLNAIMVFYILSVKMKVAFQLSFYMNFMFFVWYLLHEYNYLILRNFHV